MRTAVPVDQLQAAPDDPQNHLAGLIRIAHRSGSDHDLFSLRPQDLFQKLRGILLDLNIFEGVSKLIAPAAGITIDTAMHTAAVYIHSILPVEECLGLYKMHLFIYFLFLLLLLLPLLLPLFRSRQLFVHRFQQFPQEIPILNKSLSDPFDNQICRSLFQRIVLVKMYVASRGLFRK